MAVQKGDRIPSANLKVLGEKGPEDIATDEIFAGKKVVMFGVPGAFTPGCTLTHLPGYVVKADEIKAKGVDTIACMAVNDAFVMDAWGKSQNADQLLMLADGLAEFTRELGLELDASGAGLGIRCKRFALIANDGVIEHIAVDESGGVEDSAADRILEHL